MTRDEALAAFKAGEDVEYKGPASDWTRMRGSDAVAWGALADDLLEYRIAPRLSRCEEFGQRLPLGGRWMDRGALTSTLDELMREVMHDARVRIPLATSLGALSDALDAIEAKYLGKP